MTTPAPTATPRRAGAGLVLAVLASSQFLMTLDSSVMNVSMPTVAADLGTTITGIQTAITLYTLVMATLMITGGKLGTIMGRRRAMGIGLVIYAAGSFTTGIAPNLTVLLIGWSLLEGIGAALIMPAIVALVASNFPAEKRAAAYGMVAAAGAVAVAAGPLIGGAVTTYASWRYVFFGEVVIVLAILAVLRKVRDVAAGARPDRPVGSLLSVIGLGLFVFGVLRSSEWGWVIPKAGRPDLPQRLADHLVHRDRAAGRLRVPALGGPARGSRRRTTRDALQPLVRPSMLRNRQLTGGLGHVLLPVHDPGRRVLRGPAVPVRRARPQRHADRRPAGAVVHRAADHRDRHPQVLAEGEPAAGGPDRPAPADRRRRLPGRRHGPGRRRRR